jgi:hypothetical protein
MKLTTATTKATTMTPKTTTTIGKGKDNKMISKLFVLEKEIAISLM